MYSIEDTIVAPATGTGGAISVIRISGPAALQVVDTIVNFKNGAAQSSEGYSLKFGCVMDGIEVVDEVLVSIFRNPHSYTGEDSAEISCHASSYIVSRILELCVAAGARMAAPGEFTRRAFAAGRMDLAQAEAVADLIASDSAAGHRIAMNQLRGGYSAELKVLRDKLLDITSLMELELDFSEEDVEFADRSRLQSLLDDATSRIDRLRNSFKAGNAIKNGVPVAIVGPVNAGKSTLLNSLVGEERAIVSDIAGTTRDTIEETVVLDGITYRFIDTAGIREDAGKIEKIGIERSLQSLAKAEVVVAVLDASSPFDETSKIASDIINKVAEGQSLVVVRNKVDLFDAINPEEFPVVDRSYNWFELRYPAFGTYDLSPVDLAAKLGVSKVIDLSAVTGEGLDELRAAICSSRSGLASGSEVIVTNQRHLEALNHASESLLRVRSGLASSTPSDLLSQDLREAIHHIGEITGEISTDEVLGNIFAKFCIGK